MSLRRHQDDAQQLAREIDIGRRVEQVIHAVTPGGGKSLLPLIYAVELIPKIVDRICWIVPRDSLRSQGAHEFTDQEWRRAFGHTLALREIVGAERDPARGLAGYITTYQSIADSPI